MKRVAIVLLLALALPAGAQGQASSKQVRSSADTEAILRAEKIYTEGLLHGDVAALDKLFSDDYVVTKNHGELWDKATHLAFVKSGAHKFLKLDFQDPNVRIYGMTAVVTGRLNHQFRDDAGEFTGQSRYTHVYAKRNGRWYMTTNHFNRFGAQVPVAGAAPPTEGKTAKPIEGVTNKYCPIASEGATKVSVNPKIRTEYKGQYVYFANKAAIKAFEANPEKAIARMSAEDQSAIKHNETCPYTGLKVESKFKAESEGKLTYFCCAHCKWEFERILSTQQR
jgi:YHS domain-containing protein/ketosteroid isomerase-like protein